MDFEILLSIFGILIAMVMLVILVMRGINIFLIAFACTAVVAITGKINMYEAYKTNYMGGFVTFLQANFFDGKSHGDDKWCQSYS